ncbi:MAG TPA: FAD-dependent monooxygenase [Terriglobales bacterium]
MTDVVVVGGGPAGLAAAIAARLRGLRVVLADTSIPPIDKACGEGLMPDGVAALRALGVLPEQCEHAIFRGIRFVGPHGSAEARFPSGHGVGLRRTVLHDALRRRAAELGVEMKWGARVSGIAPGSASIDHEVVGTKWIVGADGHNSRVREWSGLSRGSRESFRVGLRRHFRVERWTDLVEVHWGNSGQAYVTPVAEDELCVAVISRDRRVDFDAVIRECPRLARNLRNAAPLDEIRGSATATCSLRSVISEGVALIGEASGSVDAITGEGMALAFRQAVQLGKALAGNDLRGYAAAHHQISRLPNLLGSAMLLMDRSATFRGRVLKALCGNPAMFEHLLAVHLGEASPFDFGVYGLATLGWQLLTAR